MKLTAADCRSLGVIDDVIAEPLGGAHRAPRDMANSLKTYLVRQLRELTQIPIPELLARRYAKFRAIGVYA